MPVIVALCLSASLHAEPELHGTAKELQEHLEKLPRSVFIAGEGKVQVQADRAIASLSVVTEHKTLSEALRRNETLRLDLTKALVAKGIPAERIKSSRFSSTPEFNRWSDKAKSYRVDNQVKVTVENEAQFQAVAALVDQWPDVHYRSLEPEHSEKDERKLEVIAKAVDDAMKKKAAYEKALKVKLTLKGFGGASANANRVESDAAPTRGRAYGMQPSFAGAALSNSITAHVGMLPGESPSDFGELTYRTAIEIEFIVEKP